MLYIKEALNFLPNSIFYRYLISRSYVLSEGIFSATKDKAAQPGVFPGNRCHIRIVKVNMSSFLVRNLLNGMIIVVRMTEFRKDMTIFFTFPVFLK